jgi:hypothetical protein
MDVLAVEAHDALAGRLVMGELGLAVAILSE